MRSSALICGLVVLCGGSSAFAQPDKEVAPCLPIPPVEDVKFDAMPPPLEDAVRRELGRFVGPGEPFDAFDEVRVGINKSILWIHHREDRWVVAFWKGGRAVQTPVLVYRLRPDDRIAVLLGRWNAHSGMVCQLTERALYRDWESDRQ